MKLIDVIIITIRDRKKKHTHFKKNYSPFAPVDRPLPAEHHTPLLRSIDGTDRQTDGRTDGQQPVT